MPFCGDEAKLKYQADAKLIGEFAHIKIQRLDRKSVSADGFQEITATTTDMKWPDLEVKNGPGYFGGRQVDFKGLSKKSYKDKFALQNFTISAHHADQTVEASNTEVIDELPAKKDTISLGTSAWPGAPTEQWSFNSSTNAWSVDPTSAGYVYQDKFDMELKDGVVVITVRVTFTKGKGSGTVFNYFKKKVEDFWNSKSSGLNQWVYHRKGCKRGDDCSCSVDSSAGCCKVPFKVVIEYGGTNANQINIHYLNPLQAVDAVFGKGATNLAVAVDTGNVYYPEDSPNTYAHEVGHMMGFPDQYVQGVHNVGNVGVTGAGAMASTGPVGPVPAGVFAVDADSIMGANQGRVQRVHAAAAWFHKFINTIDAMEPVGPAQ